jgi:hypothetical protein
MNSDLKCYQKIKNIAEMGVYYHPSKKIYLCFSCNLSFPFRFIKNSLFDYHKYFSPNCEFILGRDVNIKDLNNTCGIKGWDITRYRNYTENEFKFCQINKILFENFQNYKIEYALFKKVDNLKQFYSPILIPELDDGDKVIDIDIVFNAMMFKSIRKKTFILPNYYCDLSANKIEELILNGFFYTLVNRNTQCAYCKCVIGGWKEDTNVEDLHKFYSPDCILYKKPDLINSILHENNEININIFESNLTLINQEILDKSLCKICYSKNVETRFKCGHVFCCINCANNCSNCPICRHPITKWKRIYLC